MYGGDYDSEYLQPSLKMVEGWFGLRVRQCWWESCEGKKMPSKSMQWELWKKLQESLIRRVQAALNSGDISY